MSRTVGGRVAQVLDEVGIGALFGVPGGQTLPLYQASRALGMKHVLMRDERAAACAADAYARFSGRVGVCDATVGPGVTNLISGLAEALASSIPVLAVVADIRADREHLRRRSVVSQAMDQRALLETVTKWVGRVQRGSAIDDVLSQALRVATTGRPGPVAVEIPEDVFMEAVEGETRVFSPAEGAFPRFRAAPHDEPLSRAAGLLASADRPLILAGGGVHLSDAAGDVAALAHEQSIPVVTSINGKGTLDERHPLAAGVVGLFGSARALLTLDRADVVLVLGCKLDQFTTHGWRVPHEGQRVIHVDVDGEELGRTGDAEVMLTADVRETVLALRRLLAPRAPGAPCWLNDLPHEPQLAVPTDDSARVDPRVVARAVSTLLSPGDVVICDASYASGWGAAHISVSGPGRRFAAPRGLAGIGWSGGAAIGARLAVDPPARLVVLAGDGGWAYGMAEVETAARLGLDIVYVILNNSSLAWINHGEEKMGLDPASSFTDVDFAGVARCLGGVGMRVSVTAELEPALREAFTTRGPVVVDVTTSADAQPTVSLRDARNLGLEAPGGAGAG